MVDAVAGSRSTWTRWNLTAETMRQITAAGWQFASPADTVMVRDRIVTAAQELSATLSAGELAAVPDAFRDPDGVSQFARQTVFTSTRVLAAEDLLLTLAADQTGPTACTLPATYVRRHVELAYATTVHRAQGMTTDTAHVLADAATTREAFYVAMTRGRSSNKAYLVLDPPAHRHLDHQLTSAAPPTARNQPATRCCTRSPATPAGSPPRMRRSASRRTAPGPSRISGLSQADLARAVT